MSNDLITTPPEQLEQGTQAQQAVQGASLEQGTQEWLAARLGKVTASRIADVMAKGRSGSPSASRANYMAELVVERLTGVPAKSFTSPAMQWGTEHEDDARSVYAFHTGNEVQQVGFIPHPLMPDDAGASPDGLIGNDGLVEIKCPNSATHIETLKTGKIDRKYMLQMQWQMACTKRQWCDFVSYDPRMPQGLLLFIERVPRDNSLISEVQEAVADFLNEMARDLKTLITFQQREAS